MAKELGDFSGEITSIDTNLQTGGVDITISVPREEAAKVREIVRQATGKRLITKIYQYFKHRTRDANAYFWVLCDKLAAKTGIPKTEIYKRSIREIGGVSEMYIGKPEAVERLSRDWVSRGTGWQAEPFDCWVDGYKGVTLYYGSSTFDSAQMSRLIENVIYDCKEQGIETLPPAKLEAMMNAWEKKRTDKSLRHTAEGQGNRMGA